MMMTIVQNRLTRFVLLWLLCPIVALVTFRFLFGDVAETMPDFLYHAELRPLAFFSHIVLASLALVLIPFQFSQAIRRRRIALHRILGRIYVISIMAAGTGGLFLAITTNSGGVASWGFGVLAIVWVATTFYAARLAMTGQIAAHQRWMIRSAALTMASVTLRVMLVLTIVTGATFDTVYGLIAWACWIPNLLVAELIVRQGNLAKAGEFS